MIFFSIYLNSLGYKQVNIYSYSFELVHLYTLTFLKHFCIKSASLWKIQGKTLENQLRFEKFGEKHLKTHTYMLRSSFHFFFAGVRIISQGYWIMKEQIFVRTTVTLRSLHTAAKITYLPGLGIILTLQSHFQNDASGDCHRHGVHSADIRRGQLRVLRSADAEWDSKQRCCSYGKSAVFVDYLPLPLSTQLSSRKLEQIMRYLVS